MRRRWAYLVGVGLTFASLHCLATPPAEPRGGLLASIEKVEGWKPIKRRTGWWFYAEKTTENLAGPIVTGYEYRDGKLVDEFGGGSEPALFAAINEAGLEQFDFEKEAAIASKRLVDQAEAQGQEPVVAGVRDGARYVVTIVVSTGTFRYEAWNPGITSDNLAPASEKIARLKQVFDLLRGFYAVSKLPF